MDTQHFSNGNRRLYHCPMDKELSGFDGTWLCEAASRLSGAPIAGLYLNLPIRNYTDEYTTWYQFSSYEDYQNSNIFREFIDSILTEHRNVQPRQIKTIPGYELQKMPAPLDLIVICPVILDTEFTEWLILGYDNQTLSGRSAEDLEEDAKTVSEFILSILTKMRPLIFSPSQDPGSDILEALRSNDELAFAVFSTDGNMIMSSKRWSRFFAGKNSLISTSTIAEKWSPEWNRALSGETVKGHWLPPYNQDTPLNWSMIPWRNKQEEIEGIIVLSEVLHRNNLPEDGEKTHLLSKFITIEKERKILAKRLHDELGQSLSAALLNLELVGQSDDLGDQEAALQKARSLLNQTISDIRSISQQLRPSIIDDFGLTTALKVLCNNLSKTTDKKIHFYAFQVDNEIPEFYQITVFRICQEALEYIISYTKASVINVQLFQRETSVLLHIHDEDSFNNKDQWSSREKAGIEDYFSGIKEQTNLHNGDFHMDLQTTNGTELIIQFPLNDYSKELQDKSYEEN